MVSKDGKYFDGFGKFPRDPNELCHHSSRLNHTLQRRYHIPQEIVMLALQPENAEEFNRYYRQQVMRIIGHFNAVTQKQLKVRVDPRLPKGMQLVRGGTIVVPIREAKADKKGTEWHAAAAPSPSGKVNSLLAGAKDTPDSLWTAKATETSVEANLLPEEGQHTPKSASSALLMMRGAYTATDGMATVSSDDPSTCDHFSVKKTCREVVFGTPPEFKGFAGPLEATPADSVMSRSPLLL